jgi:hypothetical protein
MSEVRRPDVVFGEPIVGQPVEHGLGRLANANSPDAIVEERSCGAAGVVDDSIVRKENELTQAQLVRLGGHDYETTQIFVAPIGDWSKSLSETVKRNEHLTRSCWVRGPFTSPYSISNSFANLICFASGIGITPALGVLSQYKGDRNCIIVRVTRRAHLTLLASTPCPRSPHTVRVPTGGGAAGRQTWMVRSEEMVSPPLVQHVAGVDGAFGGDA